MTGRVRVAVRMASDPALPCRDELLDEATAGARVAELLRASSAGGPVRTCSRMRAKYRRGESLRVTFRLVGEVGDTIVSARMFRPGRLPVQIGRARDAAVDQGASPESVLVEESMSTLFWVFPQDRKLRGLAQLVSPPGDLATAFGAPWVHSELMAYTPEKAATARCTDEYGATVGFAKVQTGTEGQRSIDALTQARRGLGDGGPLLLPRPVGYLPERHMALFSQAPGRPLNQLRRDAVPEAMTALGEALSVLHRQPTEGFGPFARLDLDRVAAAGELVRAARPDLTLLTRVLVRRLQSTHRACGPRVLLHGDLHPKNVLVHRSGVSLVDLDQAGTGPAAAELGGVLARLWCPRPGDAIAPATATAAADALLDAYDRPPEMADLLWHAAAALLVERAVRAVTRVDVAVLDELEQVLTTAVRWVARAGRA